MSSRRCLPVLAAPIIHHALVLACRLALVLLEHGLPDIEEREHAARFLAQAL